MTWGIGVSRQRRNNATTWEHEIVACRKRVGDDSPFLSATWWEPEDSWDLLLAEDGEQLAKPLCQWRMGDDEHPLMEFLRRSSDLFPTWGKGFSGPFVAWTEKWVYFSVIYDSSEWVNAVPLAPMPGFYPIYSGR